MTDWELAQAAVMGCTDKELRDSIYDFEQSIPLNDEDMMLYQAALIEQERRRNARA